MSTARDRITDVARALERTRTREPEEREPVVHANVELASFVALARNAEVNAEHKAIGARTVISPAASTIAQDGCDFIDYTFLFLDALGCPEDVRTLILTMAGMTGGDYRSFHMMTQTQIGQRLGINRKTVAERIQQLIDWEKAEDYALVEIKKNDLDRTKIQYGTTEYRLGVIYYAEEFVRRARANNLMPRNRNAAMNQAVTAGIKQLASEVGDEIPTSQILQDRNRRMKNVTPMFNQAQPKPQGFQAKQRQAVELVVDCYFEAPKHGMDSKEVLSKFLNDIENKIAEREGAFGV